MTSTGMPSTTRPTEAPAQPAHARGVLAHSYIPGVYNRLMSQIDSERRGRINMRVSGRQERVLRAAADLTGETLTGFVLAAATERAQEVIERAERIEVSAGVFERFVAALDEPAEEMPTLRRYARRRSPIPRR